MSELTVLIDKLLPLTTGSADISYSEKKNMLVTTGYTSFAGNTYFKGIRLSDRLFIRLDIGIGYAHTFLNGLYIYSNQGEEKKLIATQTYSCVIYNEERVKADAVILVKKELRKEISSGTAKVDEEWLDEFVEKLVEDTYKNQINTLKTLELNKLLSK